MYLTAILVAVLQLREAVSGTPAPRSLPTVTLDSAVFTGINNGHVSQFLGIPYVQPPIGNLRLRLPQPLGSYNASDSKAATSYGPSCTQQQSPAPSLVGLPADTAKVVLGNADQTSLLQSEDCLTINVITPTDVNSNSMLPVVIWFHGGGFEVGGASLYNGSVIVGNSINQSHPVVYVSLNYRLSAFGFMPGQEVKDAKIGNLGLHDQREGMRWVQKYIRRFGGDPAKVTIWGESAGAMSVALHMVANNGNNDGLFRGAFMQSGSPIPVGDIVEGQKHFDAFVSATGCSDAWDKLECLRGVPYANYSAALNASPGSNTYQATILATWLPRVDGIFLADNPQRLVAAGKVANVPMVNGDVDDEGTFFALTSTSAFNITTSAKLHTYIQDVWFPQASSAAINLILQLYTDDISLGSPFNTGVLNALTPQYKRLTAFMGDVFFQATRRYFLRARSGKQKTWSYVYKRFKYLPFLGSVHGSDSVAVYSLGDDMTNYLVRFVNNLDPNGGTDLFWPQYTTQAPNLMTFLDGVVPHNISQDNFRQQGIAYLQNLTLTYPLFAQ